MGRRIPLTADDFRAFAAERIINAAEAAEILNCSRQYINEHVKTDKLHPIKATEKNTLFLKSEVLRKKLAMNAASGTAALSAKQRL